MMIPQAFEMPSTVLETKYICSFDIASPPGDINIWLNYVLHYVFTHLSLWPLCVSLSPTH